MTTILGISCYYHDSAAALVVDGKIVAAAQEERFTRLKGDAGFPAQSIAYVLQAGGISLDEVDHVAFHDKPFLKFERLLETYVAFAPRGLGSFRMSMPVWLREKLFQKDMLAKELTTLGGKKFDIEKLLFAEHHLSHAASAFFPSPFENAVILTLDGVGEWATSAVSIGRGNSVECVKELHFPHSLGLLYSAFTYYLGFKVNSGEYKVMGLAPYGTPRYHDLILEKLLDLKADGSFRLNMEYFEYPVGLTMTNRKFADLFGLPVRAPDQLLTQQHMDIAASLQSVTEEIVLRMASSLAAEYGIDNLCLAGGVALNCVANGKLLRHGHFKDIWVQPGAGDAGGAIGAALCANHLELAKPRTIEPLDGMSGTYLGPDYTPEEIEAVLKSAGAVYERLSEDALLDRTATALSEGKAVGWMQGRMEFGPRALGNRSILADPRSREMQKLLNLKVKYRESFRPFAPSVLEEKVSEWFEIDRSVPYMQFVADVLPRHRIAMTEEEKKLFGIEKLNVPRSSVPAITHVDYSARIQTVRQATNPLYHRLIARFEALTGCPMLVNTSFNVRGEPIVCGPKDALDCFMGTELDLLVCGPFVLEKRAQPAGMERRAQGAVAQD